MKPRFKEIRMKLKYFNYLLIFLSVVFLLRLLSSDGGFSDYLQAKQQLNEIDRTLAEQQQQNSLLKQEVNELQTSDEGIESIARQVLGMVKPNEVFIEVIPLAPITIQNNSEDEPTLQDDQRDSDQTS